jgi:cell shape-determining protein MreC
MKDKTAAKRNKAHRLKKAAMGLKKVECWVLEEDKTRLKALEVESQAKAKQRQFAAAVIVPARLTL